MNTSVVDSIRKTRLLKMTTETSMIDQICDARDRKIISRVKRKYRVQVCRSVNYSVGIGAAINENIGRIQSDEIAALLIQLSEDYYHHFWTYLHQRVSI